MQNLILGLNDVARHGLPLERQLCVFPASSLRLLTNRLSAFRSLQSRLDHPLIKRWGLPPASSKLPYRAPLPTLSFRTCKLLRMSTAERFGSDMLAFATLAGAPRKWRKVVRKSAPVAVRLCADILVDLQNQDWQRLDENFCVLYGIMNQGYGDDINLPRMSAIEPWLYEELIIPVLRSGASIARIKAALTFEWRCRCRLLGEAQLAEVLRCILPLAVLPAPEAGVGDKANILIAACHLVEREIRLVQESADPSSTAAAEEEHRLRWLFGAKCGLLQTLLASFEVITNEEQDSDYLLPFDLLTSVGWSLVPYVEARGQYADELALAFIKAFQAHPLYLQTAELSLDSVASSHAVHQEQLTECCEGCNTKHSQQLARVLAALAEAHPSLAGYLRSRGLRVKADSWHARLPGAQEPLSRLLKAFSALPATGSGLELPRQGSKGAKSCALCGAVRSSCGSSSGGSSSSEGQHSASSVLVGKLRCCSKCRSVYYCCQACQLADWSSHRNICRKRSS